MINEKNNTMTDFNSGQKEAFNEMQKTIMLKMNCSAEEANKHIEILMTDFLNILNA
jgi:hypothetical protein